MDMAQVFSHKVNIIAKASLLGGLLSLVSLFWAGLVYTRSWYEKTGLQHIKCSRAPGSRHPPGPMFHPRQIPAYG